jgi:hypothetical protein
MSEDRRTFFRNVGAATVVAAALTSAEPFQRAAPAAAAETPRPVPPSPPVALELQEVAAGPLQSVHGTFQTATVVVEKATDGVVFKHLGPIADQELVLTCATGMTPAFYAWISETLAGQVDIRDGAVVQGDRTGVSRVEFFRANIGRVVFPGVDASSRDPLFLEVTLHPERIARTTEAGAPVPLISHKQWLAPNFRLHIDGLDTTRVDLVEPITAEAVFDNGVPPTFLAMNPGNLVIRMPETHAQGLLAWHREFVVLGNNDQSREKYGVLEYLDPRGAEVLFAIEFFNLGIFALSDDLSDRRIRRLRAEMYCEALRFHVGGG